MANRLWAAALVLSLSAGQAQTKIWVVNANGTGDFTSLTAAIDSAASGDSIFVAAGGYVESPHETDKRLTILGVGFNSPSAVTWRITLNSTLRLGPGSVLSGLELYGSVDPLIRLSRTGMIVQKCHVNVRLGTGINIEADSCIVADNIVEASVNGQSGITTAVDIWGIQIRNNIITGNTSNSSRVGTGIQLNFHNGGDVLVANNFVSKFAGGISVNESFGSGFSLKVYSNIIADNGFALEYWSYVQFYSGYNCFFGNTEFARGLANFTPEVGSTTANPGLVNYSSTSGYVFGSSDLHLASGSPCIDVGEPNTGNFDRDGSRNDIGIYGGPDPFDDSGAPIYPSVITVVVSPYAAPLNGTITIKVLGRIGQ